MKATINNSKRWIKTFQIFNKISTSNRCVFSIFLNNYTNFGLIILLLLISGVINATTYYSRATGNWNSNTTWSLTSGGSAGTSIPNANDIVYIENNKTVTLNANTANLTALYINSGSILTTTAAYSVNASNIYINGTYINGSSGTITGTVTVNSTGIYQHNQDGGIIPTATWNSASTCIITGYISQAGGTDGALTSFQSSLSQNFGNFTWNSTSQTTDFSLGGTINGISGNFSVISTGSGSISIGGTGIGNLTIGGNFSQSGGIFQVSSSAARTMTVNGSFTKTGGTFDLSSSTTAANATTVNIKGNFGFTSGTITETGSTTESVINFNGTGTQTFTSTGTFTKIVNFAILSGATVDFGTSTLSSGSSGSFTLNSGATIITANTNGTGAITTSGATGTIQVTGTRTYNAGANYTFNGTANQTTGNGLPTNLTGKLTIRNSGATGSNTVTLNNAESLSNGGSIYLTSGVFGTGTNLTMNAATSIINRSEGSMTGTIQGVGPGTYNVNYSGNSKTCGSELSGGGLNNVVIGLTAGQTLTLDQIRIPDGNLSISNGSIFNLSTFTFNRSSAGGTLTIASGATLKIGGTNTLPSNYSTHNISCTSTIEYSGTNQTVANLNSSQTYGNLTLSGSGAKTLQIGTTNICSNFTITGTANTTGVVGLTIGGNVLIDVNALFTAGSFIHNIAGNWTKSGTFAAAGSTINFNSSSVGQSIGSSNFNNISFNGTGTKTAIGILSIAGDVTISSNFTAGSYNHTIAGNWANNGTFTAGSGTITMTATAAKTIGGATDSQFYNLIFNETGSSSIGVNTSVTGTLTLTQGFVDLSSYTFTVSNISGGSSNSYVKTSNTGRLKRLITTGGAVYTFPVGNSAYNPISFSSSAIGNGNSDYFSIRVEDGALTNTNVNAKTVNRKWYLMCSTTGITALTVTTTYNTGETGTSFNAASNPKVGFFTGTAWGYGPATAGGSSPYTITATGAAPDVTSPNAYLAVGSDDAFSASKLAIAVLPPTPYRGINSSVATVQSQNSSNIPTWVLQSTYFNLTSNKSLTRIGGLTDFAITAGTHETIINNLEFLESTWNETNLVYDINATVTATQTSGQSLVDGITPVFAIKDGGIYKPSASGNWSSVQWLISNDGGTSWTNTNLPTDNNFSESDVIQIPSDITLTCDVSTSFNSLIIFGTLDINSLGALTLNHSLDNMADYNICIYGTLKNSGGSITNSNTTLMLINAFGGSYWHNRDGGSLPTGSWKSLNGTPSTCKVTGITVNPLTAGLDQSFQNFTWDNASQSSTQTLTADFQVYNTLTLSNGVISTGSYKVEIEPGATTNSSNNSRINGNIRIHIPTTASPIVNFPIGDANYYTPLMVTFTGTIVGSGYLDAYTSATQPPASAGLSQTKYLNRIWTVSNTNISGFTSFNTKFTFVDADKMGSPNTSALVVRKKDNNIWAVTTTGTYTENTIECTGMNTFSSFAIGEDGCNSTDFIWLGGTNTDWNTATNWCSNTVPSATNNVTIPSDLVYQPVIGASGASCKNLTIAVGATLTVDGSNQLTVKGNIVNNGTLKTNTSTIMLSGINPQSITGDITFQNLTINNATGVTAQNDLTVNGILYLQSVNASLTAGALDMGAHSINMGPGSTTTGTGDVSGTITRTDNFSINKTYSFGNQNSTIQFISVPGSQTFPTSISVGVVLGSMPDWASTNPANAIKRQYTLGYTGTASGNHTIFRIAYLDSELQNGTNESLLSIWSHVPSTEITNDEGWSNYDVTQNYISISDVDFANLPPSLQIVIAPSSASYYTWNGSQSTDWNIASNWTPNGIPSSATGVMIPDAATTTYDPSLPVTATVKSLIITSGGILNSTPNATLLLTSSGNTWAVEPATGNLVAGTFNAGTSTVTITNTSTFASIVGATNFYNLTIADNAQLQMTNGSYTGISGALSLSSNGILDARTNPNTIEFKGASPNIPATNFPMPGYYNLIINSSISGTPTWSSTVNIGGNFTNNYTGLSIPGTVVMNGTIAQTIGGSASTTLNNLTIDNASGITSTTDLTINGTLNFISDNPSSNDKGALDMINNSILHMGVNATTTGLGDVSGIINRSHTFNTATFYTFGNQNNGVTFAAVSGYPGQTLPSSVSLKVYIGRTPDWSANQGAVMTNPIKRYYDIYQTGGIGTRALMQIHFRDNEVPVGISKDQLTIWTSSNVAGTYYNKESGRSGYNTNLDFVTIQDVDFTKISSTAGDFRGTLAPSTNTNYTWIGTVDTDWNNSSNWTPNGVPDATHGAIIPNTYTTPFAPTLPSSASCVSLQINAGGVLNAPSSNGTFTLTGANAAWSIESGGIFNANTSTVIFNANSVNSGDVSIVGNTNFYNVIISNGTLIRPATNSYIGIAGTLTNNGTFAAATNENTVEFNGINSQSIPNPNGSTPGYHILILSNSGTKILPSSLNIFDEFTNNTSGTGTVVAGSGTVFMNGNSIYGQTINGSSTLTSFNNLTIDNPSNLVLVTTQIGVNQTLNITSGSILDMGTNALSGTGSTSTTGSGTIYTQNTADYTPLPSGRTWSGTVIYNGTSSQKLVSGTYNNLTITNTAGVTALGDLTVNGILNLSSSNPSSTQGVIETSNYTLSMGNTSTTIGNGDVTGTVKRQHSFLDGQPYSFGNQFTKLTFMGVSGSVKPLWVSCKIAIGTEPLWKSGGVQRTYNFAQDGTGTDNVSTNLHYLDSEINSNDESKIVLWDYHSNATIDQHGKTNNDATNNWIGLSGLKISYIAPSTTLTNKQWGLFNSTAVKNTWLSADGTTNWNVPENWSSGHYPGQSTYLTDSVLIPAGVAHSPVLTLPVEMSTLEIESGASLVADSYNVTINGYTGAWYNNGTFTSTSGSVIFSKGNLSRIVTIEGTNNNFYNLQVNANTFIQPTSGCSMKIAGSIITDPTSIMDFTSNQNTVEFNGGDQTITNLIGPSSNSGYHDFIISGFGTKTLSSTLNIAGDFINNGTVDCGTGTVIIKDQGHEQNIGGSSTTSFYNLTIDNTNQIVNALSNFNVNNTFAINANTTLIMGTNILGGSFSTTSGTGTLKTQNTSSNPLLSGNTWTFGVIYNNTTVAQTIASGTYASLQISNSTGTTASGALNCSSLTLDNGSTLDMGTFILSGVNTINGTGTLKTQNTSSLPIPSEKTWSGIIEYNGTSPQTAVSGTFGNIGINNPAGVSLATDASILVNGTLLVNSGKNLTIGTGTEMNAQLITNNAGITGITVVASSTAANGSLIFNNNPNSPVDGTVQMYSKASWQLSNPVGSKYKWQYFGIPIKSLVAEDAFYGAYVRRWDEPTGKWIQLDNSSVLTTFTGYEITQEAAKTYTFSGQLENQEKTYTYNSFVSGQYLFSNPYTAAIDIKKLSFTGNMDATVYLYNTGSYSDWYSAGHGNNSGENPGQYVSIPIQNAGSEGLPAQIPSMQGFLIGTTASPSTASITIPYSAVVKNSNRQRVKASTDALSSVCTVVSVKGSRFSDKMWLFTNPTCSHAYDNGWDGTKFIGSSLSPQIWAAETDGDYQVNTVDNVNNTILNFMVGEDSQYTLTFNHSNTNLKYSNLYLIDLHTNTTTDITQNGTTYTFNASATTPITRFKIVSSPNITTDLKATYGSFKIFGSGQTIFVENSTNSIGNLSIYDLSGRIIERHSINSTGMTTINTVLIAGSYIIKVTSKTENITKKIIIN